MRRRDFLKVIGGSVAAWPIVVHAQPNRMRRIGVLVSNLPADDPEWQARSTAFVQGLQQLGWSEGRNLRIDFRWGLGDADRVRKHAAELVALAPDVLLAAASPAVEALQRAASTTPIVFANVVDPVSAGYVASLARPGANTTGFMSTEFAVGGKLLELLKQVAPSVKRVAVLRNSSAQLGQLGAIQAVAPSFGVELTPVLGRDAVEIERAITAFTRGPNDGLVVTGSGHQQMQRETILTLANRYRLPAVYAFRGIVAEGGLISYGIDQAEPYRLPPGHAARVPQGAKPPPPGYADRVLKGETPAALPVQAPTKFETVLNVKTAKALGLQVPDVVRQRA